MVVSLLYNVFYHVTLALERRRNMNNALRYIAIGGICYILQIIAFSVFKLFN